MAVDRAETHLDVAVFPDAVDASSVENVVAAVAEDLVASRPAKNGVGIPRASLVVAVDDVVATVSPKYIITGATVDLVISLVSGDVVGADASGNRGAALSVEGPI